MKRLYSLQISAGILRVPGAAVSSERVQQMGLRVGRQLTPRLSLELGYNKWNSAVEIPGPRAVPGAYFYPDPGQLRSREGYQMIDLNAATNLITFRRNHRLNAGLAASYAWGTDVQLTASGPVINTASDAGSRLSRYFGICPNLGYTCALPGRLVFGAEYKPRWYFGQDRLQHDLSLLAGLRF